MATTLTEPSGRRGDVVIEDRVVIPAVIDDLASFRRWAQSDDFPERGEFSWLGGDIWVDLSMEQLFSHNQVKAAVALALLALLQTVRCGRYVLDRMRLTNPAANLSTEPDGLYFSWESVRAGRVRLVEGAEEGFIEIEGTPEMVLEVVSSSSERKDNVTLRDLYARACIPEYWLIDARGETLRFEILELTDAGYQAASITEDEWHMSPVFGHEFRFEQTTDPLGHPEYTLNVRR